MSSDHEHSHDHERDSHRSFRDVTSPSGLTTEKQGLLHRSRREFLRDLGISAFAFPLIAGLPSLGYCATPVAPRKRMIILFSPNGIVPKAYWPDQAGRDFTLKEIMKPLEPFKDKTLIVKGVCDKVQGDGDNHMRGMSCLLTGIELLPGNIQGGSHTPAGWASGLSIDQEIKGYLQSNDQTRTRFGSLEFGVNVPDKADPWTRMVYAGRNKPIAPIDDPYAMFEKLYGQVKDQAAVISILDSLQSDLKKVRSTLSTEDRVKLDEHEAFVRHMEHEFKAAKDQKLREPPLELEAGIREDNENMPKLSKMQIDLMVNSFVNDMARVATLQYTCSVGQARMSWLGVKESHHTLSHEPGTNDEAQNDLIKINTWYAEQMAYLAKKLADTPEPDGSGSMLDHTTIIWTNELGEGASHTLNDIPLTIVGGGLGWEMGRSLQLKSVTHNRLHMSIAHAFGHHVDHFGNPNFCGEGVLPELTTA